MIVLKVLYFISQLMTGVVHGRNKIHTIICQNLTGVEQVFPYNKK